MEYQGWNLFDKVMIIAKPESNWRHKDRNYLQGYVVDPSNKSMLKTARQWAHHVVLGEYDKKTRTYPNKKEFDGIEEIFDNEGFTLKLLDSADKSCEGGKLSFWNCLISKGDKAWVIGIDADLLLDVLKNTTVVNGVVREPLFFARQKGRVGMLSTNIPGYQQALKDMNQKATLAKNKTSKHIVGHIYSTLQRSNVYLGDVWSHWEPVYNIHRRLTGFKRRKTPVKMLIWMDARTDYTKASEYIGYGYFYLEAKLPARQDTGTIEVDVEPWQFIQHQIKVLAKQLTEYEEAKVRGRTRPIYFFINHYFGLSPSPDNCELPIEFLKYCKLMDLTIEGFDLGKVNI